MRKKFVSIVSLLVVIVSIGLVGILNIEDAYAANGDPQTIYATEDTTLIYETSGNFVNRDALGILSVGYMAYYYNREAQSLLKFTLPKIPAGYEIESASLYFPVREPDINPIVPFSLKVSTSTNHFWAAGSVNSNTVPKPTIGSTQSIPVSNNTPILGPIDITSYIIEESLKTNPKATLILSAFSYADAVASNSTSANHYINTGEMNGSWDKPYLTITYSEKIEITGVVNDGIYNTNVTPTFNRGTAKLNGSAFTSGSTVSAEGSHTLVVTDGSQSETIQFRIDKTSPTGTVIVNQGNQYTSNTAVSVSITPAVGVNDITHIQYSVNGNPFTQMPYISSFMLGIGATNGDRVLSFKLVDGAGNESPEYQRVITLDTVSPTGSVVINNGNAYTTNRDVTLNLALDSGVTDVVGVQYSNNNSNWSGVEAFSPTKSYTLPAGDGNKTVYVRLIDRAGNITLIQDSILLDTTAPTGTVVVNDGSAYTNNSNVYVDITPAAGVTDIVSIRYTLNGLAPTTIVYTNNFTINVGNTDGAKVITVELIDGAGRVSPVYSATVTLDKVAPSGTVAINGGAAYATNREVTLDLTLGADIDDVVNVRFSNDNVTWSDEEAYSASKSYTLPAGDGSKTVYVRFNDRAGNDGSAQDSIMLDTTPPTGTISINNNAQFTNSIELGLTLTTPDSSDIKGIQFSTDGTTWSALEAYTSSKKLLVAGNGEKTVHVKFVDKAGNEFTTSSSIYVDTVKPVVSIAIQDDAIITLDKDISLTINASDPGRELETVNLVMELSHDGISWLPVENYIQSKAWTVSSGFGTKQVYVRITDEAHNVSNIASASIVYRSIPQLVDSTVNALEDTQYSFDLADFQYTNHDSIELDSYTLVSLPQHGLLTLEGTEIEAGAVVTATELAELVYVPELDWFGSVQLVWHASADVMAAPANAVLTIQVNAVNDVPVAENMEVTKTNYNPVEGSLVAEDGEGDTLTYYIVDAPLNGKVVLNELTGEFEFTLDHNQNGTYIFTYRVFDGMDYSNPAKVTIKYEVSSPITTPTGFKLKLGENGTEVYFTGQVSIQGNSISIHLTENQLTQLNTEHQNQPVVLSVSATYPNAQLVLEKKTIELLVANGNSLVFSTTGVQFTLSNQELKQMLTTNHSSFIINIQQASAELIAKAQEQAMKGAYQIIGTPVIIEVLAQNDDASTLYLPGLGQIVLNSTNVGNKISPTALLKLLPNGELTPILAVISINGQSYQVDVSNYGAGTYTLISKQPQFTDVSGWSKAAIELLASKLILNGVDATTFEPDRAITRAEFASIISKALGLVNTSSSPSFTDITTDAWYADAIATVAELGFMNGYTDGTYRPAQQLTREEAMVIVARVLSYLESNLSLSAEEIDNILAEYVDQDQLGNWSRLDIALTVREGIIMGNNGQLNAKDNITREQIAAIIVRLLERTEL